jgi:hypothetical protein
LPVKARIPDDAAPGDHVAGVVASLAVRSRRNGLPLTLDQRVGTQAYFRVAGPLTPGLAVEDLDAHYTKSWNPIGPGGAIVTYRLHNIGNVILGAKQHVVVDGLLGETASASPGRLPVLLPDASVDIRVPVRGVSPEVLMTTKVELTPIVPSGSVDTGVANSYSATTHFWAVPWLLIGIVLLTAAAAIWLWRWRRVKNSRGRHGSVDGDGRDRRARRQNAEVGA